LFHKDNDFHPEVGRERLKIPRNSTTVSNSVPQSGRPVRQQ